MKRASNLTSFLNDKKRLNIKYCVYANKLFKKGYLTKNGLFETKQ